jgi:hypothetical protein
MFKLRHIFERFISYLYGIILLCILVLRHEHVHSFHPPLIEFMCWSFPYPIMNVEHVLCDCILKGDCVSPCSMMSPANVSLNITVCLSYIWKACGLNHRARFLNWHFLWFSVFPEYGAPSMCHEMLLLTAQPA